MVAVTYHRLDTGGVGHKLCDLGLGLCKGGLRDVGHQDAGPLLGEENACLETNATVSNISILLAAGRLDAFLADVTTGL